MAITITDIPNWQWVKNPCYVELTGVAGDIQFAKIQLYNGFDFLSEGYYVAKSDYLKADISGFVKAAFDLIPNDRTGVTLYRESETYLNLTIVILVNDDNEAIYSNEHTFIYGGKDVRDSFTINDYAMVSAGTTFPDFLIEFERLTIWKGLPHDIRFTADTEKAFTFGLVCYDRDNNQTAIGLDIAAQDYLLS